jgi:16S rRNA (cytidine1402-2'-O)-methyltransferase
LTRLNAVLGDRVACVARELTKLHEEIARGTLAELATRFAAGARGEFTLVVAGAADVAAPISNEELDEAIRALVAEGRTSREISDQLGPGAGLPKREVYARVLALKRERVDPA